MKPMTELGVVGVVIVIAVTSFFFFAIHLDMFDAPPSKWIYVVSLTDQYFEEIYPRDSPEDFVRTRWKVFVYDQITFPKPIQLHCAIPRAGIWKCIDTGFVYANATMQWG